LRTFSRVTLTLARSGLRDAELAFLGPVGFVRKYVRKFAVWVVIASLVYLCWWSLHGRPRRLGAVGVPL
jgi:hypothetical protein